MGCCPAIPPIKVSNAIGYVNAGAESDIQRGESVECYAGRAGNQTGKLDDATENAQNKIDNTAIPISPTGHVDVTFKLTSSSSTTPTSWTFETFSAAGVTFTSAGATATLIGTFSGSDLGKPFEVLLTAKNGSDVIDSRTFRFSASVSSSTDAIKLISPLPGSIVNSKFGPRVHPITKVMKAHTGIDMKFADRSTADVVAAGDGEVVFAGISGTISSGYGNCIKIKHTNGSGVFLCTTLYGHLAKIYVSVGQKVSAGQKIGHEGTTGSSTGNHLHFEVRLPNNTPVDPAPYLNGVSVADSTTPSGDASGPMSTSASGAVITKASVEAQSKPCPAPAVDPETGAAAAPPAALPPPIGGDPFEHAWYYAMTVEVGPHWMTAPQFSPGDPDIDAGLFDTPLQKKKVGYKPGPNFPGGETKFGVAQNPNRSKVNVKTLTYEQAKSFGRSGYWDYGLFINANNCQSKAPLIGIMLFDLNYLHGPGNAKKIMQDSGQLSVPQTATHEEQLAACEAITTAAYKFVSGLNPTYVNGWNNRTRQRLAFVKSLSYPLS